MSGASLQLIQILQQTAGFGAALDALRQGWQLAALVHRDVRWDNWLVRSTPGQDEQGSGVLVDWESAGLGDPYWDIGSTLSHFLSWWVTSIPVTGETPPEHFPALAERPLEGMHPAIRACWHAYVASAGFTQPEQEALGRTVRYAAARLVLIAFEMTQMSEQLTSPVVLHLQLAANMLQRPEAAAVELLGLGRHPGHW